MSKLDTPKNPHAVSLGRLGGLANKGIPKPKSAQNARRKYPPCTAKRHRFWAGKCSHCGIPKI